MKNLTVKLQKEITENINKQVKYAVLTHGNENFNQVYEFYDDYEMATEKFILECADWGKHMAMLTLKASYEIYLIYVPEMRTCHFSKISNY